MNKIINLEKKIFFDIQILGKLLTIESAVSLLYLLLIPREATEALLIGYSKERLILISLLLLSTMALGVLTLTFLNSKDVTHQISQFLFRKIQREQIRKLPLHLISTGLVIGGLLLIFWGETSDQYYQGILSRMGPFLIFGTIGCAQLIYYIFRWVPKGVWHIWGISVLFSTIFTIFQWSIIAETHQNYWLLLVFGLLVFTAFFSCFFATLYLNKTPKENSTWLIPVFILFVLLIAQLQLIPKSYWRYREEIFQFMPVSLLLAFFLSHLLTQYQSSKINRKWLSYSYLAGAFVLLIFLGNAYFAAAIDHSNSINVDYTGDQRSFMGFTEEVYKSGFTNTGNRNQMPGYPFVQALFYDPENDLDEFFISGKETNIWLSLFLLALLFAIFRFFFSLHQSLNLIFVVAFASFIFRSPYFKVEILFYFLSFLAFLFMTYMVVRPTIKLGIVTGLILGYTHLTKASIIPGIIAFIFIIIMKELVRYRSDNNAGKSIRTQITSRKSEIFGPLLVIVFFLATISPYILESKKEYGQYFYNVNYFVMWFDSWEEAEVARDEYGFHNIPENEIPGFRNYFATHSISDIAERIQYGFYRQGENFRYQFNLFNFPIFFLAYLMLWATVKWRRSFFLIKQNIYLVSFVFLFMAGYFMLFVWHSPIVGLSRFLYGLFIPLLFSIFVALKTLSRKSDESISRYIDFGISAMLLLDIPYVLSVGLFLGKFGS